MTRADQAARRERMAAMYRNDVDLDIIAALFGVQRPAIYKVLRKTGDLPPYKPSAKRPKRGETYGKAITHFRVDRDPCPRCGIRRDVGCPHTAASFSAGA